MKPFVLLYIKQGEVDAHSFEQLASILIYGKTETGESCCIEVVDFLPYFYFYPGSNFDHSKLDFVKNSLERQVYAKIDEKRKQRLGRCIKDISIKNGTDLNGYHEETSEFIKVTMAHPNLVTKLRDLLESGDLDEEINGYSKFVTYESDILFTERWIIDKKTSGGGWLEIVGEPDNDSIICMKSANLTRCHYHYQVKNEKIISHRERGDHAPIRIFGFDIECAGKNGVFPTPEEDPVIQISVITEVFGIGSPKREIKCVHVLGTCLPSKEFEIITYKTEKELLLGFSQQLADSDSDILIGYNICNFDIPYLIDRSKTLGIEDRFCRFSKRKHQVASYIKTHFESRALGTRNSNDLVADGFVVWDLFQAIQRDHKLRNYSLNHVSKHFLNDEKADVPHSQITPMHEGDERTRYELALYCYKDTDLPFRLISRLMIFYNNMEMARVCMVPLSYILGRGQSVKVMMQILSACKERGFIVPYGKNMRVGKGDDTYQGATVIEPVRGFYKEPVATLDFASLYPSIMMAHNLCYCTLIKQSSKLANIPPDKRTRTPLDLKSRPEGVHFVKKDVRKGVLPEILEKLIAARKKAKIDLANETDPFKKGILDGRQLALKISANSVYGFTGATIGKLPCFEISASVTSYGRQMIDKTANFVIQNYTKEKGYKHDAKIIYGDTDSVMVIFGCESSVEGRAEAMRLGKEAADRITKEFIAPIKLEFEKVYDPYLLINKKRYAALFFTKPEKPDKKDSKGLENVRRDTCPESRKIIDDTLNLVLNNPNDPDKAVEYIKKNLSDLVQNKVDPSLFIMSKKLKPLDSYKSKGAQPHVTLYYKHLKRDPRNAPRVGDRVPYIIKQGSKSDKVNEKAEDPLYAIKNGISVDSNWYLDSQIKGPIQRILEYVISEKKLNAIFNGDHMNTIVKPIVKIGIAKFAVVQEKCLSCKTTFKQLTDKVPLKKTKLEEEDPLVSKKPRGKVEIEYEKEKNTKTYPAVCENCEDKKEKIFSRLSEEHNELLDRVNWLTENCMKCKNEPNTEGIICSNTECQFYFERYKKIIDCEKVRKDLKRFPNANLKPLDKRSINEKITF